MRKKSYVLVIITVFLFLSFSSVSATEIMNLSQVNSDMKGTAYTVFEETKVESFPVDIISITDDEGIDEKLILVKTAGEKMEEIGGIASGMSGSPVYIDQKLVGAIAYSWSNGSGLYALVTPIEKMLKLLDESSSDDTASISDNKEFAFSEYLTKSKTPLMVSGLTGRALEEFKDDMEKYDIRVRSGGDKKEKDYASEQLGPGSAIAVQLVKGDINISSIGTITYMDENNLLAFGHSFTNKGEVDYMMSEAYIDDTIPNDEQPFKLGSPIERPLGTINLDRGAGVAGDLDNFPEVIPFQIKVKDNNRDIKNVVELKLVEDEKLLTSLAMNSALQSIDSIIDRVGKGTAKVELSVMGSGLPNFEVERKNTFYSNNDIAARSLSDFNQLLELISTNPYRKIDIKTIDLEVDISKKEQVAFLKEVKVLNDTINPGDKLDIEVLIQPYRKEAFKKEISVKLPEDIQTGMNNIIINGGFTGESYRPQFNEEDYLNSDGEVKENTIQGYKNFEEIITEFINTPKNNEIIVQVYPGYNPTVPNEEEKTAKAEVDEKAENENAEIENKNKENESKNIEAEAEIKELFKIDYVLEGSLNLYVEVEEENKEDNEDNEKEDESENNDGLEG